MPWFCFAVFLLVTFPAVAAPPEDRPGQKFHIRPSEMPVPYATRSASNGTDVIRRRANQTPVVPAGYQVNIFAEGLSHARWMAVAPNGDVFLAQTGIDEITLLVDTDADGRADDVTPFVTGLDGPHGLAFRDGRLYIADLRGIWQLPYLAGQRRPDLVRQSIVPDVLFQAHSAPLGLVFADSDQFPPDWRDDALVALHGSWNAASPTGYKVVRVPFENGRPTGGYENFVTRFWVDTARGWSGAMTAQVIGRPAGLALARDGSLLIADDVANVVWRVRKAP